MYVVISVSFIALLLTFLESEGKLRHGMTWGFVLVTIIGAIHYNYGNDYMNYYNLSKTVLGSSFDEVIHGDLYRDFGWVLLNYAFKPFGGFFTMVATLNVIQNIIVYNVIRREVPQKWWAMAVFIYLFNTNFYLMSFTMMRQELVIIIFLGIWPWIKQRRFLLVSLILYLCTLIHSSAIVLIPFAFWGFLPTNNQRIMLLAFIVVLGLLWSNQNYINTILSDASDIEQFTYYFRTYGDRTNNTIFRVGLGSILNTIPIVLCFIYLFSENKRNENYVGLVWISLIGSLLTPLMLSLSMISRISMYFSVYNIVTYPQVYGSVKNVNVKIAVLACYMFLTLYNYFLFFNHPVWIEHFTTYHTIFEVL